MRIHFVVAFVFFALALHVGLFHYNKIPYDSLPICKVYDVRCKTIDVRGENKLDCIVDYVSTADGKKYGYKSLTEFHETIPKYPDIRCGYIGDRLFVADPNEYPFGIKSPILIAVFLLIGVMVLMF